MLSLLRQSLCGTIVGVYEEKVEADIDTLTEPRDNPFKFKSAEVKTGESRKFDRSGRTQRKKKFKQHLEQYKEEDIKQALRKGSKLVSYLER
jgi:peptide subunit release factor RF-3